MQPKEERLCIWRKTHKHDTLQNTVFVVARVGLAIKGHWNRVTKKVFVRGLL